MKWIVGYLAVRCIAMVRRSVELATALARGCKPVREIWSRAPLCGYRQVVLLG